MSVFNLQDVTTVGAYCNALRAIGQNDQGIEGSQQYLPRKRQAWRIPTVLIALAVAVTVTLSVGAV